MAVLWDEYVSKSPLKDLVKVLQVSDTLKPQLEGVKTRLDQKELELQRKADVFKRAKTRERRAKLFKEMVSEVDRLKGFKRLGTEIQETADEETRRIAEEEQEEEEYAQRIARAQELMRIGREGVGADESKEGDEDVDG